MLKESLKIQYKLESNTFIEWIYHRFFGKFTTSTTATNSLISAEHIYLINVLSTLAE